MKNALMIGTALLLAGCSSDKPSGHWEGKGRVFEEKLRDDARTLTRKATTEFWFTLRPDGSAAGEIEVTYGAQLTVDLGGSIETVGGSFNPTVSGALNERDAVRRFPLAGFYENGELVLQIAVPEDERPKLDFVIRADAGTTIKMPGGFEAGKTVKGGEIHVPMTAFSPFATKGGALTKSFGRQTARYEEKGKHYEITWSARKVEDLNDRRTPSGPEIDRAIESIRAALQR